MIENSGEVGRRVKQKGKEEDMWNIPDACRIACAEGLGQETKTYAIIDDEYGKVVDKERYKTESEEMFSNYVGIEREYMIRAWSVLQEDEGKETGATQLLIRKGYPKIYAYVGQRAKVVLLEYVLEQQEQEGSIYISHKRLIEAATLMYWCYHRGKVILVPMEHPLIDSLLDSLMVSVYGNKYRDFGGE